VGLIPSGAAMTQSTIRLILGGALAIALGIYLYGRYTAFAEHDLALTQCMQGHDSARALCERSIDQRR
jgi:hypothetical protein